MFILTLKTDNPTAEIGLYDDEKKLAYESWEAHRELSMTIHQKIEGLLKQQQKTWQDIAGIVCFAGPGSFTGLRIGLSVGNALSYGLSAEIVSTKGEDWIKTGITRLMRHGADPVALPFYGAEAHVTLPRQV